ncbi:AI-2E family transporter [Solicola gregarius]|uniref:AI-2E family transporter n=1 Tax=Solicola gregarius TaxID=2908642 RepID=A0AA46YLL3_9ACTN|nr:AI-2E family transporter [Solicola gregarius]UYM05621.1 AI-2E family transporter [Solicola gregarius]
MTQSLDRQHGHRESVIGQGIAWLARWSMRWIIIAIAAYLMVWLVGRLWTIVLPVALALIVSTVLAPPARFLREKAKFPPALAAISVILGGFAIVGGVLWAIAPSVADQVGDIAKDASEGLTKVEEWLIDGPMNVSDDQISTAIEAAQDKLTESASTIASGALTGVGAVTGFIVGAALVLVLTFFFVKDGPRFLPWLRRVAGDKAGGHIDVVLLRCWVTLGGFIRTQAIVSFVDAVFIGIGLLIVGVPLAVPLAIMTFFGGFIPIVGAFVFGALAVLVALVSNGVTGALIVLAIILGVQQLEGNVLSPWLQGRSMKLHAAVILLAVALGSTLFGITGAFLAVPVVAVVAEMLRYLNETIETGAEPHEDSAANDELPDAEPDESPDPRDDGGPDDLDEKLESGS